MSILIRNVYVVDGSGSPGFYGEVLVAGGKIAGVTGYGRAGQADGAAARIIGGAISAEGHGDDGGRACDEWAGGMDRAGSAMPYGDITEVHDGEGLVCCPGFIDTHSHCDLFALTEGDLLPKLMQGVTTDVLGQDGISMAPLPRALAPMWRENLSVIDGDSDGIDWGYETIENYLGMLENAKPALNTAYLAPHGNLRMAVMGLEPRKATAQEIERMCALLREGMEAGCFGLSTGLIYLPCDYADTAELVALCKVVAAYGGVFSIHQRSEGDDILASMDEVLAIGAQSGVHIHFAHFKVCGAKNQGLVPLMLRKLDRARENGIRVTFDQYPYPYGSTMLRVCLPPWMLEGGPREAQKRLKDPGMRKRAKHDIENGIPGWDNLVDCSGFGGIFLTGVAQAASRPATQAGTWDESLESATWDESGESATCDESQESAVSGVDGEGPEPGDQGHDHGGAGGQTQGHDHGGADGQTQGHGQGGADSQTQEHGQGGAGGQPQGHDHGGADGQTQGHGQGGPASWLAGCVGKSLEEIAAMRGTDCHTALFDVLEAGECAVGMVDFYGTEEMVRALFGREEMNVCTDGLLVGRPHPRAYGSFARVFERYALGANPHVLQPAGPDPAGEGSERYALGANPQGGDEGHASGKAGAGHMARGSGVKDFLGDPHGGAGRLPLEAVVHKCTGKAAQSMGFADRGLIRAGMAADLVLLDLETIHENSSFEDPCRYPDGIRAVMVNGEWAVRGGTFTGARAGQLLRRPAAPAAHRLAVG
ncbi:MAG: amidohydrolase family protein [Lachnospiraceae bacterium]|jgi:N-acyl-D-aspartate/D-glutamate deacylase|nr:amidohydrolase family protein [Lachnospiraceae bacterium]